MIRDRVLRDLLTQHIDHLNELAAVRVPAQSEYMQGVNEGMAAGYAAAAEVLRRDFAGYLEEQ